MPFGNTFFLITVFLVLLVSGLMLIGEILNSRHILSDRFHEPTRFEYELTVQDLGDEKKAQTELEAHVKPFEGLDPHPVSESERERYRVDWAAVQSGFVDQPAQAIVAAERLIMEVMELRANPVSNHEQRAADYSAHYPALVMNYRASQLIAFNNDHSRADTEELRQAMIYYRSLFDELLEKEARIA